MYSVVKALLSGKPVLLSPEGGRSHQPGMRKAKTGIIFILEKTKVPIVPVGLIGATDDFLTRALKGEQPIVKVIVGSPFMLPDFELTGISASEERQAKVDAIMSSLAAILPGEYQGYYRIKNP
jgi:1-acyl-sn-glycerol-3-phosphate acyltransferase